MNRRCPAKKLWNMISPWGEYVFSVPAAPVAQTCSLLYRRFLTCQLPLASNVLPITNRRYGRLKICATLNRYLGSRSVILALWRRDACAILCPSSWRRAIQSSDQQRGSVSRSTIGRRDSPRSFQEHLG